MNANGSKEVVVMLKEQIIDSWWFTYAWIIVISLWGGMVSFFENKDEKFSWLRLFAHLLSASFAGMMTFYICQYGNVPESLTGAFCGIAAHFGTPALLKMRIVRQFFDNKDKPE